MDIVAQLPQVQMKVNPDGPVAGESSDGTVQKIDDAQGVLPCLGSFSALMSQLATFDAKGVDLSESMETAKQGDTLAGMLGLALRPAIDPDGTQTDQQSATKMAVAGEQPSVTESALETVSKLLAPNEAGAVVDPKIANVTSPEVKTESNVIDQKAAVPVSNTLAKSAGVDLSTVVGNVKDVVIPETTTTLRPTDAALLAPGASQDGLESTGETKPSGNQPVKTVALPQAFLKDGGPNRPPATTINEITKIENASSTRLADEQKHLQALKAHTGTYRPADVQGDAAPVNTQANDPATAAGTAQANDSATAAGTAQMNNLAAATGATQTVANEGPLADLPIGQNTNSGFDAQTNAEQSHKSQQTLVSGSRSTVNRQPVPPEHIRSQVVEQLLQQDVGPAGKERISLQLEPAHLGKLQIQLQANGDRLTVIFTAASAQAERALREGVQELVETITGRAERWQNVNVKFERSEQQSRDQQSPSGRDDQRHRERQSKERRPRDE